MAQCPLPLASGTDLATNYDLAGIEYSQKPHKTHTSSERNRLFRNMMNAGDWQIDIRPAEAKLQQLASKDHKAEISMIPNQKVDTEADLVINSTELWIIPLVDMLRRSNPAHIFQARPEDITEGVIQFESGEKKKLSTRIDVVIHATEVLTNRRKPILMVEIKVDRKGV